MGWIFYDFLIGRVECLRLEADQCPKLMCCYDSLCQWTCLKIVLATQFWSEALGLAAASALFFSGHSRLRMIPKPSSGHIQIFKSSSDYHS